MQIFFGTLSVHGLSSVLMPENDWLLMINFPDPEQAGRAATNFIANVKHLPNNIPVAVTGTRSSIGAQPVIVMSDINAAGALIEHAVAGVASHPGGHAKRVQTKGGKTRGGTGAKSRTPTSGTSEEKL